MSAASCLVCGGSLTPALIATDRNRRISEERFVYHRCTRCATLSLVEVPEDLARYYPPEYYALTLDRASLLAATASERYKLEIIGRFVATGRLIEVGPAIGGFTVNAQEAGYETTAVEMDARSCAFLKETLSIPCTQSDDPAAVVRAQGPFDVVAMWHVLEHLSDPMAMLEAVAASLAPGGVLALAVPNPEAFQFGVLGVRWAHLDAPRHLHLIPAGELVRRGAALGLESALLTFDDPGTRFWNRFGWRESLGSLAAGRYPRLALKATGEALSYALAPLDRRAGRGATYTLVLRRPRA